MECICSAGGYLYLTKAFSPHLIEDVVRLAKSIFQSPPHRGMECIMANTFYSNLAFYFQSPPHRGMECIRDHRSVHLRAGVLSVPSSSGNGVHPPALLYQRHILRLSVPSSSGNGVHPDFSSDR